MIRPAKGFAHDDEPSQDRGSIIRTSAGVVNIDDLLAVISAWGACPIAPAPWAPDIAPGGRDGNVKHR